VVQEYIKTLKSTNKDKSDKKKDGAAGSDKDDDPNENSNLKDESDLFYYSKMENKFKVFNPKDRTWSIQDTKPTEQQLTLLRQ
jgi:hypothetical protein